MPATRDGKAWRSQFYYEDWQGIRHKKNKRGFKTKAEAEEWERNFRQQQRKDLDINFENFVEIYFADMENRLRESTIKNKRYVFDLKVTPYFKKKKMCEIKTADIRAWQNELIKQGYAQTYLKSINNQLAALFNYAVRYYDLKDNPCRKAGSIGKSKADDMEFWTKQEFKQFLPSMDKKPEAKMAFIKCEEMEAALRTTEQSLAKLHRLLDNKPIEYVVMVLSGEMQAYCDIEDEMVKGMFGTIVQGYLKKGDNGATAEMMAREFFWYES